MLRHGSVGIWDGGRGEGGGGRVKMESRWESKSRRGRSRVEVLSMDGWVCEIGEARVERAAWKRGKKGKKRGQ